MRDFGPYLWWDFCIFIIGLKVSKNKTMKRTFLGFAIVISLFSFDYAHATSGACSYHGGVNCSAGADYFGRAICNDGSSSSIDYSEMHECRATSPQICSLAATEQLLKLPPDEQYTEIQLVERYIKMLDTQIQNTQQQQAQINQNYQNIYAAQQQVDQAYANQMSQAAFRSGTLYTPDISQTTHNNANLGSNTSYSPFDEVLLRERGVRSLCQTEIDTYNNWKTKQSAQLNVIPPTTNIPSTTICPTGFNCIADAGMPSIGQCPAGYVCLVDDKTGQAIDNYMSGKGAFWNGKTYICQSSQQQISPVNGVLICPNPNSNLTQIETKSKNLVTQKKILLRVQLTASTTTRTNLVVATTASKISFIVSTSTKDVLIN